MERTIFYVADEPYCMWGTDQAVRNRIFLAGIDADYYRYVAALHRGQLDEPEHRQRAAIALRTATHHGLETLVALLGVVVQAPYCVYGWMLKYKTETLTKVAGRISKREVLLHGAEQRRWSWSDVAAEVFRHVADGAQRESAVEGFGRLWASAAAAFLNPLLTAEYNSIKHGGRARPGPSSVSVALEESFGVPPPAEDFGTLMASNYGTSFFEALRVDGAEKHHVSVKETSLLWDATELPRTLELISLSINNIVVYLFACTGEVPDGLMFRVPTSPEDFELISGSLGFGHQNWSIKETVTPLPQDAPTRKELRAVVSRE